MKTFTQWLEWDDRDDYLDRRPHNRRQRANLEPAQYVSDSPRYRRADPAVVMSKSEFTIAVVDAIHKGLTRRQIIRHLNGKINPDITRDQNALLNTVNDNYLKLKKKIPIQDIGQILKTIAHQTKEAPLHIPTPEEISAQISATKKLAPKRDYAADWAVWRKAHETPPTPEGITADQRATRIANAYTQWLRKAQ